jgi:uncharacterized protein YbjT (DUF2867 family)
MCLKISGGGRGGQKVIPNEFFLNFHAYYLRFMEKRTAIVFGATGLVGNLLLEELVRSGQYGIIRIFVRQSTGILSQEIEQVVTDFTDTAKLRETIKGDDLFICLGTTIKKAGSVENMEKIDRDLPVMIAEIAFSNGVRRVAVVSSIGADSKSKNYYLRIKGEMEEGILNASFEKTVIVRPSMLLGERKEKRPGELAGKVVMKVINPVLAGKLLKFRAVHGRDVARAMILLLDMQSDRKVFESDDIQRITSGK